MENLKKLQEEYQNKIGKIEQNKLFSRIMSDVDMVVYWTRYSGEVVQTPLKDALAHEIVRRNLVDKNNKILE